MARSEFCVMLAKPRYSFFQENKLDTVLNDPSLGPVSSKTRTRESIGHQISKEIHIVNIYILRRFSQNTKNCSLLHVWNFNQLLPNLVVKVIVSLINNLLYFLFNSCAYSMVKRCRIENILSSTK